MDPHLSSIPWNTPALWQEANSCLSYTIHQNQMVIAESRRQARQIERLLELIFPFMERSCRETCPSCTDICCRRAWVWADFKDLLFYHMADITLPDQQLLSRKEDRCLYGGPDGCRLDRIQRPFVCSWYLCPALMQHLRQAPAEMKIVSDSLHQIKRLRQEMERSFIRAIT